MATVNNKKQFFVRFFNQNSMKQTQIRNYRQSIYFPDIMKDVLRQLLSSSHIKYTDYILCPLYRQGDFQIGITGTVKKTETDIDALSREMGEELGIFPHEVYIHEKQTFINNKTKTNFDFSVFSTNIKKTGNLADTEEGKIVSNEQDLLDKVGCFIYGEETDIISYLNSPKIFTYKSSDNIVGVCGIKVTDIRF